MSGVKKCPKCGGEIEEGDKLVGKRGLLSVRFAKKDDFLGDQIIPFYCKNCGFIEIYKEMPSPPPTPPRIAEVPQKFCKYCGYALTHDAKYCSKCGKARDLNVIGRTLEHI